MRDIGEKGSFNGSKMRRNLARADGGDEEQETARLTFGLPQTSGQFPDRNKPRRTPAMR